jgi:hypothetical protein
LLVVVTDRLVRNSALAADDAAKTAIKMNAFNLFKERFFMKIPL